MVLVLDCNDPERLAGFWCAALHYRRAPSASPYLVLVPFHSEGPELVLQQVPEVKTVKNRLHIDLRVAELETECRRLEALGATRAGQDVIEKGGIRWVVMADPEGNEFCVRVETPPA